MTFIKQWQEELPNSLACFTELTNEVKDIDFMTGILAAGVLWPIRQAVQAYEREAADAVHELVYVGAEPILQVVNQLPDDRIAAARLLAEAAQENKVLRAGLNQLIQHFDATQLFAGQLAQELLKRYPSPPTGNTFNISEEIRAALVNIGGITNINDLIINLSVPPPPLPKLTRRQKGMIYGLALLIFLSSLLGLTQVGQEYFRATPPMTGDFNVAVAQFEELDEEGRLIESQEAHALAEQMSRSLKTQLKDLEQECDSTDFQICVLEPSETGPIRGTTSEERTDAAEELAETLNADVIVYGNIKVEGNMTSFVPEFHLSDQNLKRAEELTGHYGLSSVESMGDYASNSETRKQLRKKLQERTEVLAEFVFGLSRYYAAENKEDYEEARAHFQKAEESPSWNEEDGKEILYLFLGNVSSRLKDYASSEKYFEEARRLNSDYSRAWVAMAGIKYLKAKGKSCQACEVNEDGLREAEEYYQQALTKKRLPLANTETKVAFGLGQVYFCLSQAGIENRWLEAERELQTVVEAYEKDKNERLQELASEAHAVLGFLYWFPNEKTQLENLSLALVQFELAIERSTHDERKAFFSSLKGKLHDERDEYEQAQEAFEYAIDLARDARDDESRARYEQLLRELQDKQAS